MYANALPLQLQLQPNALPIRDVVFHPYQHSSVAISLSCALLLLLMLCPLLLIKALVYFCPLLLSTGICLTAFYRFFRSQDLAREGLLLIKVGKVEHVVEIRVSGEAKFGVCSDHVKVDCFLVGSSQGEGTAFIRRREPRRSEDVHPADDQEAARTAGVIERARREVDASVVDDDDMGGAFHMIRTDSLAEGLWDCYFGSYSTWHYDQLEAAADSQVHAD